MPVVVSPYGRVGEETMRHFVALQDTRNKAAKVPSQEARADCRAVADDSQKDENVSCTCSCSR